MVRVTQAGVVSNAGVLISLPGGRSLPAEVMLAATPLRRRHALFGGNPGHARELLANADRIPKGFIAPVEPHLMAPVMYPAHQSPNAIAVDTVNAVLTGLSMSRNEVENELAAVLLGLVHQEVEIVERIRAGTPAPSLPELPGTPKHAVPRPNSQGVAHGTSCENAEGEQRRRPHDGDIINVTT